MAQLRGVGEHTAHVYGTGFAVSTGSSLEQLGAASASRSIPFAARGQAVWLTWQRCSAQGCTTQILAEH